MLLVWVSRYCSENSFEAAGPLPILEYWELYEVCLKLDHLKFLLPFGIFLFGLSSANYRMLMPGIEAVNVVCSLLFKKSEESCSCLTSAAAEMGTELVLCIFHGKASKVFPTLFRPAERWPRANGQHAPPIANNPLSASRPPNNCDCEGRWGLPPTTLGQSINHNPNRKTCNNRKQEAKSGNGNGVSRSITWKIQTRKSNPLNGIGSVKNHNMCLSQCKHI